MQSFLFSPCKYNIKLYIHISIINVNNKPITEKKKLQRVTILYIVLCCFYWYGFGVAFFARFICVIVVVILGNRIVISRYQKHFLF